MPNYSVNQYPVSSILTWVKDDEIAVPEIQRPFVWSTIQVRDLMDSLYKGYPIGYIITWKNPDVRLRDGSRAMGKKVVIDGQQRITAMRAAILGMPVVNKDYAEEKIYIAFHPIKEEFATLTPAIERDSSWIPDISTIISRETGLFEEVNKYCEANPGVDKSLIEKNIEKLRAIRNSPIGYIELDAGLDIDAVTDIFIRVNSQGTVLSQADFAMSKIASYGEFGVNLRKLIDYFCHLAIEPQFYDRISQNDREFSEGKYLNKISWLKNETGDLYDPSYADVIRVSFTKEFERGKLSDLVSLLAGRNFETKTFEQSIQEDTFKRLEKSLLEFINETNFKRFIMIMKSAGFITSDLITSQNTLNFAYILYLKLKEKRYAPGEIENFVRKWFVMSLLTGRYSGSPESVMDNDIKGIANNGVEKELKIIEDSELSSVFWNIGLVNELEKASLSNPFINVFFAAQIKDNDEGFLSRDITVNSLIQHRGDVHHIFPKDYLKSNGLRRGDYNQIANLCYAQSEINIKVAKKAPKDYFRETKEQCQGGKLKYGNIDNLDALKMNMKKHCIPETVFDMDFDNYFDFLEERRRLMAKKIEKYYKSL
ncbi:MAG: hypothetical protein CO014_00755 [Candidatus Tagabacteria bacterium CG_4_8_14_3_um_filter_41_8]|uniref:GmrSD restriction endonucleases N-terminal domain-containing protein n=1 Tax=Candidatus Tagabacteria bacterium CG_4_8_14_3_um_filter_41_8 TaxID=1975018 RepID=A0A2M8G991_9BACT|nr:MAG: hypothetical protein CO014_00755 [Candidatus Tagabacteria bacterium CG_4_8_14_3_um_filter_41_8]